jgi:hypothetical protein
MLKQVGPDGQEMSYTQWIQQLEMSEQTKNEISQAVVWGSQEVFMRLQ